MHMTICNSNKSWMCGEPSRHIEISRSPTYISTSGEASVAPSDERAYQLNSNMNPASINFRYGYRFPASYLQQFEYDQVGLIGLRICPAYMHVFFILGSLQASALMISSPSCPKCMRPKDLSMQDKSKHASMAYSPLAYTRAPAYFENEERRSLERIMQYAESSRPGDYFPHRPVHRANGRHKSTIDQDTK